MPVSSRNTVAASLAKNALEKNATEERPSSVELSAASRDGGNARLEALIAREGNTAAGKEKSDWGNRRHREGKNSPVTKTLHEKGRGIALQGGDVVSPHAEV